MRTGLILGGTGAMGEYLIEILNQNPEWQIHVTSRSDRKNHGNIKYIKGNARDHGFMRGLLSNHHYDVIVDFMNYGYDEFMGCHRELLDATGHYVFLSSSRVFDRSEVPITEESPRLLDVTTDQTFLQTQRYALRKARQENMLMESGKRNYTIVRPYITYSDRRLQLGIYEKEQWLYRLLKDKPLIMREEILSKKTTLTYGGDVACVLDRIMAAEPLGSAVNIMTKQGITWKSILSIYERVIKEETGKNIQVLTTRRMPEIEELFEGGYNTKYDRLFDRLFDNGFVEKHYGHVDYMDVEQGLGDCLRHFIRDWKSYGNSIFLSIMEEFETVMDGMLIN